MLPVYLGAALAVSASAYLISRAVLFNGVGQELRVLTELAAAHAGAFAAQRENDLATLSQSPLFKDHAETLAYGLVEESEVYRREIEKMLSDFSERAGVYPRLSYRDAAGREQVAVADARVAAMGPTLELRRRLLDAAGRPRGELVFTYTTAPLTDTLSRLTVGETGRTELLPLAALKAPPDPDVLREALPVPGTQWAVASRVPRGEVARRLGWVGALTALIAASMMAFIALLVTRLVRRGLKPVSELAQAADAVARGERAARVIGADSSELAGLSDSFNTMAERLDQRTRDLEQKVRELTALQRMNEAVLRRLSRAELGKVCLEAAAAGLGAARGGLFWVDAGRGTAAGACGAGLAGVGVTDEALRAWRIPLDGTDVVAECARRREPVFVSNAPSDPRCDPAWTARLGAKAFCAAPILVGGEVAAVLCLDGPGMPDPERLRPALSLFAGAAGLALENGRLMEAVTESEARYRTAVENSPDAVIGLDQALRVTLWNRRAEALFGWQPSEARGRELEFILTPEAYRELRRRVETFGSVRQEEVPGRTRDGRDLELSVSWTGRAGGPGAAREWFVVVQDVTEKKRLQGRLIHAEKLTAVGNLVAGLVHELNNPMTSILGYLEMTVDRLASGDHRTDLRVALAHIVRCKDIVHRMLIFVRETKPEVRRISLNDAAQAALELMDYRLRRALNVETELVLDPARPEAAGDARKLQQVLLNLLNNAVDSLVETPGRGRLTVRVESRGGAGRLVVEDNGPGVSEAARARLFQPFFTTKPLGKGTGLGLSVSRDIVLEMNGRLTHEAVPGSGARFVVSLPPCPEGVKAPEPPPDLPAPTPGLRALAVDDEPEVAELMARFLREDGLAAEAAPSPEAAGGMLAAGRYDLVVTDAEMGPVKGLDLVSAARDLPEAPAFLLVSGDIMNGRLQAAADAADVPLLAKPFLRADFLRVVRRLLKGRRAPRARP